MYNEARNHSQGIIFSSLCPLSQHFSATKPEIQEIPAYTPDPLSPMEFSQSFSPKINNPTFYYSRNSCLPHRSRGLSPMEFNQSFSPKNRESHFSWQEFNDTDWTIGHKILKPKKFTPEWGKLCFPRKGHQDPEGNAHIGHEVVGSIHEDSQAGLGLHHIPNFPLSRQSRCQCRRWISKCTNVIFCQVTNNVGIIPKPCPESVWSPLFSPPQQMVALWRLLLSHKA